MPSRQKKDRPPDPPTQKAVSVIAQKQLHWVIPDTLPTSLSNWVGVQHDAEQFTISFCEIRKPFLFGTTEEMQAALESLASLPAVCVARVVISPTQVQLLINTLNQSLAQYLAARAEQPKS